MTDEKEPEKKLGMAINNCGFGFVVTFDAQPTTQEFCEGLISLFHTASQVVLQKEAIKKALEEAQTVEKKQFFLQAYLDEKTGVLEAKLSVSKPTSPIVRTNTMPQSNAVIPLGRMKPGKRR